MSVSDSQRVVMMQKKGIYYESSQTPAISKRNYPSISPPKKRAVNNYVPGLKLHNSQQSPERVGMRTTSTRVVKDSNPYRGEYEKLNVTESYINNVDYSSGYSTQKNSVENRDTNKLYNSKLTSNFINQSLGPKIPASSSSRYPNLEQKQWPTKLLPTKALPLDSEGLLQRKVKLARIENHKVLSQRKDIDEVPEGGSRAFLRVKSFTAENSPEKLKKDVNKMSSPYLNVGEITKNLTVGEGPSERKNPKGNASFYENDKGLQFDRAPGVSVIESCLRVLDFCNPGIMDILSRKPKKHESRSNSIDEPLQSHQRTNSKVPKVRIKLAPVYDCKLGQMIAYNEDYHSSISPKHINFAKATATIEDSKAGAITGSRLTEHFPAIQKAARSIEKERIQKLLM